MWGEWTLRTALAQMADEWETSEDPSMQMCAYDLRELLEDQSAWIASHPPIA